MSDKRWHHSVVNRLLGGAITHLRLTGVVDEAFDPSAFESELQGHVLLDLGRVERLSSFGVRKWMQFTRSLPLGVNGLYLIHLPPFFVDQLNMVEGFVGVAEVVSILAPYTCGRCNEERVRVVDVREESAAIASGQAPAHTCPVCREALTFADQPAEFFDYVRQQRFPPLDQTVRRYLHMLRPSEAVEHTTHNVKVVEGDITFIRLASAIKKDFNARKLTAGLEGRVVFDFAGVHEVAPDAGAVLHKMLQVASDEAQVFLWRVPPPVLNVLAPMPPGRWKIASLQLPGECRSCGNRMPQSVLTERFVQVATGGEEMLLDCPICGGLARLPLLREQVKFLTAAAAADGGFDEFAQIEPRALSKYIVGAGTYPGVSGAAAAPATPGVETAGGTKLQVLKRLGQGGMAEVFLAKQVGMKGFEKYCVIKKVLESFANSPEFVEMLFAEARANARLNHANIVQTYDVGMMGPTAYIAMEYVRGPDVKRLLQALRKAKQLMPIDIALRIVADTAAGLHYAHNYVDPTGKAHPMVHRDVSPHNILVSLDGAIKLSDFGIAKIQGEGEATQAGTFKGKIGYVSPEAIAGLKVDGRNDVFALGVTLYELLTGQLPFKRESEAAVLRAIVYEQPPNPTTLNPHVPEDVAQIIFRAMEKKVDRRTASAGQMRNEIEAAMMRHGFTTQATDVARYLQQFFPEYASTAEPAVAAVAPPAPAPARREAAAPPKDVSLVIIPTHEEFDIPLEGEPPSADATMTLTPTDVSKARALAEAVRRGPVPPTPLPAEPPTSPVAPPAAAPPVAAAPAQPPRERRPIAAVKEVAVPTGSHPTPPAPTSSAPVPVAAAVAAAAPPRREAPPVHAAPPPAAPPPAPALAKESAPRQASSAPPPPAARPRRWSVIIGSAGMLLSAAAVVLAVKAPAAGPGSVEVLNLEANERLFVGGVAVEAAEVKARGAGSQIIAVAQGGRLVRFGNAPVQSKVDTRALVAAPQTFEDRPDQAGHVHVSTDPPGCFVVLQGSSEPPQRAPATLTLAPGLARTVEVACPGKGLWTEQVLAVPGQSIMLAVSP